MARMRTGAFIGLVGVCRVKDRPFRQYWHVFGHCSPLLDQYESLVDLYYRPLAGGKGPLMVM